MSDVSGKLISELKVHELRAELIGRGLDGNGVKTTLVSRLEKALSEQGVDINTFLFVLPPVNQNSEKTKGAVATAESIKAVISSKDVEKDSQPEEEQQEEVAAEDLVEKVDDEQSDEQAQQDDNNGGVPEDNDDPDIGDLEERQESEEEETPVEENGKDEVMPMEVDPVENQSNSEESPPATTVSLEVASQAKVLSPKSVPLASNTSAIHVISDEEDVDYEDGDLDAQTTAVDRKESENNVNVTSSIDPASSFTKDNTETKPTAKTTPSSKKFLVKQVKSTRPKVPSGLKFPADDPQGLRCLWIRGIPAVARTSELKLAFMDAGFHGEAKIFCPKQTATSKQSAFGFVILETEQMAADAVQKMHNSIFKGGKISVERACDSSMLQSDLVGTASARNHSHPPIKPPEKPGNKKNAAVTTKPSRTRTRPGRGGSSVTASAPSGKSNYLEKVRATRILRHPTSSSTHMNYPLRRGANTRIVVPSNSYPSSRGHHTSYSTRGTRPTRGRHMSPSLYVSRRRSHSSSRHHSSSYRERNRVSEDRKIIEGRYEDTLRRKDEERSQRELKLKLENERYRDQLEKERLAKENLELKLRLAQVSSSVVAPPSRRRPSPSIRRQVSPVRRHESLSIHRSVDRRPLPSSSYTRHAAPGSPRRIHRSRSPHPRSSPSRYDSSRSRRPLSPPPRESVNDRGRDRKPSYRGTAPVSAHRFDSRGERERDSRPSNSERCGSSRDERPSRRGSRDYPGNPSFDRGAGSSSSYPSRRSGNGYERGSGSGAPVPPYSSSYGSDYRGGNSGSSGVTPYSTSSRNPSTSTVPSGSWPAAPAQYAGNAGPPAAWQQAPTMPTLAQSWNQFPQPNVRGGNTRSYGQY